MTTSIRKIAEAYNELLNITPELASLLPETAPFQQVANATSNIERAVPYLSLLETIAREQLSEDEFRVLVSQLTAILKKVKTQLIEQETATNIVRERQRKALPFEVQGIKQSLQKIDLNLVRDSGEIFMKAWRKSKDNELIGGFELEATTFNLYNALKNSGLIEQLIKHEKDIRSQLYFESLPKVDELLLSKQEFEEILKEIEEKGAKGDGLDISLSSQDSSPKRNWVKLVKGSGLASQNTLFGALALMHYQPEIITFGIIPATSSIYAGVFEIIEGWSPS